MRLKLPLLGTVTTGKDTEVQSVTLKERFKESLGGFLDFFRQPLSNEKEISSKLIKSNEEWVYINVSTLAEVVSSLEFELFTMKMVKGQLELEPIEQHELLDLLNKFNEVTTKNDAIYNTEAHLDLAGDSFWLLDGGLNKRKPNAIYLLQPDNVSLKLGDFTKSTTMVEAYEYKVTVDQKTIEKKYDPDEIIHIKLPNPGNPYRGKSTVEALATTIDTDNYAQEALKNLFKNGLIGDFFLTTDKRFTPEQLKNLAAQFKAAYTGVKNFWKVPILYGGLKPEKLMSTGREMQLIELEEWFRNKIMSAFKNTRASLGLDDEVNRSTAEASLANWKRSVIAPKMARIVNALNEYLVPRYGNNLLLGFKDPVPEDRESEIAEAEKLFKAKIITKNEARQIIGYDEVDGGDEFETVNPLASNFEQQLRKIPALKYIDLQPIKKFGAKEKAKDYKETYKQALPVARQLVKSRRNKNTEEVREHSKFSNEQVWNYHNQKIQMVGDAEDLFKSLLDNYIDDLLLLMLNNLPKEFNKSIQEKQLISDEEIERKISEALGSFSPVLASISVSSGNQALQLIGSEEIYTGGDDLYAYIRRQVRKFAKSMIETDQDTMAQVIANGINEGRSVAQIERSLRESFPEIKKLQSTRITRTEVLKASNHAAVEAWIQSGLVTGKQWLTAEDDRVDPLCASLNGKIIDIDSKFFKKGETYEAGGQFIKLDYSSVPEPPLHVSCRCDVLPVVVGQEDFDLRSYDKFQEMRAKIAELEDKVDKRTKAFKELQVEKDNSEQYAKALEKLISEG